MTGRRPESLVIGHDLLLGSCQSEYTKTIYYEYIAFKYYMEFGDTYSALPFANLSYTS